MKHVEKIVWHGKPVGEVRGRMFIKHVRRRDHFLRFVGGYAIQLSIYEKLKGQGIELVEVYESDTGNTLTASLADFERHGRLVNLGHGEQICLAERFWNKKAAGQMVLPL
ncbi:hypothetical protein [Alicyclobacillus shizuokensis]|uniref:hypothetical protein n=1 Tax=Alicyclobacillus shizuokensis TaxID=392014 RepID=UPI000835A377|nr:hypothetical protein [Alicyclobacillus shizuokensis]